MKVLIQTSLKEFLVKELGLSGTKVKGLLDKKLVFVNNRRVWIATHQLRKGDTVEVQQQIQEKVESLPIVYDDQYYCIINKPAGILTNGSPSSAEELLRKQLNNPGLFVVHRIDRDTTGLVLVAKSKEAFDAMKQLFKERKVTKEYRVLIFGNFSRAQTIRQSIDGEEAITHLTPIKSGEISYCRAEIETGRTHQIRIHCKAIGHPVLGDKDYQTRDITDVRLRTIPHQMLHAYRLAFDHPFLPKKVEVTVPEPGAFKEVLKIIR
jgi:23S rRNA pseudouridine1911/1915/1917 synthase